MISRFYFPSRVLLAPGGYKSFLQECPVPFKRLLLITGKRSMQDLGVLDIIRDIVEKAGIELHCYSGVTTNPSNLDADNICSFREDVRGDAVLALGGGSCIDLAKIVAMQATNGGNAWDYVSVKNQEAKQITKRPLPLIAVPTTAGSGSEASPYAVITNVNTLMKKGIGHPFLYPLSIILDPELHRSLSPRQTMLGVFDVFNQALESYTSKKSTLHSRELSFQSMQYIATYFNDVLLHPDRLECRANLAWASSLSGLAIGLTDVNLAHALSHPISAYYGLEHGLAVQLCSIQSIRFNQGICKEAYAKSMSLFGKNERDDESMVDALIAMLVEWLKRGNFQMALKDYGVTQKDLERFADDALEIGAIRTNIRSISRNEVLSLYKKIWDGDVE